MLCLNISDTAIITVKEVDYCCILYEISRCEIIHLLESSVHQSETHQDRGYI